MLETTFLYGININKREGHQCRIICFYKVCLKNIHSVFQSINFWLKSFTGLDISLEDIRTFLITYVSDFSVFAIGYEDEAEEEDDLRMAVMFGPL